MVDIIDIGHGVGIRWLGHSDSCPQRDSNEGHCGITIHHVHPNGKECDGAVMWCEHCSDGHHVWVLESLEPLTISPSVLQRMCGLHGFIRGGKWVPA